jgi:hypothetical protein
MVESFLDYILGPHGRYISGLLLKYQFPASCVVFIYAIFKIVRRTALKKQGTKGENR